MRSRKPIRGRQAAHLWRGDDPLARALAFNGLGNAAHARHQWRPAREPLFAGDTLYAWSKVLDKTDLGEAGALRLRLVAVKNRACTNFPDKSGDEYDPAVVLDFDYWAAIPKR